MSEPLQPPPEGQSGHLPKFYDIHYHALDLSHANITAFLSRMLEVNPEQLTPAGLEKQLRRYLPRKRLLRYYPLLILLSAAVPLFGYKSIARVLSQLIESVTTSQDITAKADRARNLLSFMENAVQYDFLILEYFLQQEKLIGHDNLLHMDGRPFRKMVLCPLIIDFGYKNINNPAVFYNIPPEKPVTVQIRDLFQAIRTYYGHEISISRGNGQIRFNMHETRVSREEKFFEIYPFMGINTMHYSYEQIAGMLDKYFGNFRGDETPGERQQRLYEKMGRFDGDMSDVEACRDIFAGIKVYPPLGFDPLPDGCSQCAGTDGAGEAGEVYLPVGRQEFTHGGLPVSTPEKFTIDAGGSEPLSLNHPRVGRSEAAFSGDEAESDGTVRQAQAEDRPPLPEFTPSTKREIPPGGETCRCERAKVRLMYRICEEKRIPVITHCSTGGFVAERQAQAWSDPAGKWEQVLAMHPRMKLNFAHFGAGSYAWRESIIRLTRQYEHVYADFSCQTGNDVYYQALNHDVGKNSGLDGRILFGSDFMIHLLWHDSYNSYLTGYMNTGKLPEALKFRFATENPERFLFG